MKVFGNERHQKLEIFGICESVCVFRESLNIHVRKLQSITCTVPYNFKVTSQWDCLIRNFLWIEDFALVSVVGTEKVRVH